tara:strand:+ start:10957 stop:11667 length:711 start_codon:yes stop_codon:yes gene_type:complete
MLSEGFQNISSGKITNGIPHNGSINAVLNYIEEQLKVFQVKNKGETETVEDTLNERLAILFQRNIESRPFFFKPEKIQNPESGRSAKTDIGVLSISETIKVHENSYGEYDAFFEIECKRLPTLPKNREKEYVTGQSKSSGAIERFKERIHAKNLAFSAIIGYIQKENPGYWFEHVNTWVDELITSNPAFWKEEDQLIQTDTQLLMLTKYISKNYRENGEGQSNYINLTHFWVNLVG